MMIEVNGKMIMMQKAADVASLLSGLGLSREETLVKINGKLASDGRKIRQNDQVKVIRVIFGG